YGQFVGSERATAREKQCRADFQPAADLQSASSAVNQASTGQLKIGRRIQSCPTHENSSEIGSTPRSTTGIGRPCAPGNSIFKSTPSPWNTVAAISAGDVGRSFGAAPMSSDAPTTCPPLMPPPAITTDQHCGQ